MNGVPERMFSLRGFTNETASIFFFILALGNVGESLQNKFFAFVHRLLEATRSALSLLTYRILLNFERRRWYPLGVFIAKL